MKSLVKGDIFEYNYDNKVDGVKKYVTVISENNSEKVMVLPFVYPNKRVEFTNNNSVNDVNFLYDHSLLLDRDILSEKIGAFNSEAIESVASKIKENLINMIKKLLNE